MSSENKPGLFTSNEGKSLFVTFALVSSLFLLWGFCNGMIDVMDVHFQQELHLTLSQSAWVQFAHYLGYFLMAMPAGWLATKLGYRGGIIVGLLMVAVGGFWFIPATHISSFWAFLLGVCTIASGLTFLETVANPYTTVLGPKEFAPTRINLAQSCNGIGWIFGPIAGRMYFYSKDASGASTGSQTLWIPYAGVAVVVVVLAVIFYFAPMPDVRAADEYNLDDDNKDSARPPVSKRGLVLGILWLNIAVLAVAVGMIVTAIATIFGAAEGKTLLISCVTIGAIGTIALITGKNKITDHSIWSHTHFSSATLAQFFYVAGQCGIFGFFINYMISQVPAVPNSWRDGMNDFANSMGPLNVRNWLNDWFEIHSSNGLMGLSNGGASMLASLAFIFFLTGRFTGAALLKKKPAYKVLGTYGVVATFCCALVFAKLGWVSVGALFLTYFFMSIMFPTIFSLGIFGLGSRAKKASSFIVMAIMGGAIMPKLMGHIADKTNMSVSFIVPLICFALVALYGFSWAKLSKAEGLVAVKTGGH